MAKERGGMALVSAFFDTEKWKSNGMKSLSLFTILLL